MDAVETDNDVSNDEKDVPAGVSTGVAAAVVDVAAVE